MSTEECLSPRLQGVFAALDDLGGREVSGLPVVLLRQELLDLHALTARLEAAKVDVLRAFGAVQGHRADLNTSLQAWLRNTLKVDAAEASRRVRTARVLPDLPKTEAALRAGDISIEHADLIATGVSRLDLETMLEAEDTLLTLAKTAAPRQLSSAVRRLVQIVDPDESAEERAARQHDSRYLHLTQGFDGCWNLEGRLDPAAGAAASAWFEANSRRRTQPDGEPDPRTPAQIRADAFSALIDRGLGDGSAPTVAKVPAQVSLVLDLPTLRDEVTVAEPGSALLSVFERSFGPATLERLTCCAEVRTLLVGEVGQPIAIGRAARFSTSAQNTLMLARDGGCIVPGCENLVVQAHHIVHWASEGGRTDVDAMVLLCSSCHHLVHEDGWRVEPDPERPGLFQFRPPDGRAAIPAVHSVDRHPGDRVPLPCRETDGVASAVG